MESSSKVLLAGVGNTLFSDEGLGPMAVDYIVRHYSVPERLSIVDGGTKGFALVELLSEVEAAVVVDAVRGGMQPGYIYRVELTRGQCPVSPLFSLHQLGLSELVELATMVNRGLTVVLIGMEPQSLSPSMGLSALIRLRLPVLAHMVAEELRRFGIEMERL